MKQFLITLAGVFAGLVLFFVGLPFVLITLALSSARPAPPPTQTLLALDLRQSLPDQDPDNPFAGFGAGRARSVMSAIDGLRRASTDGRVKGLLIRLPEGGLPPAAADELRLAVLKFRQSGKPVIAHSQGLYPGGGITSATYMLGAASGAFWMQPGASLQSTGVMNEDLFFKRAFDKYGVTADYEQRYQYKNAVNPYLYDDYTPAHREAELGWMTGVYTSELGQAAHDRKLDPAVLRSTLEAGPYSAEDALAKRLIDHTGQVQEAEAALRTQTGAGAAASMVDLFAYRAAAGGAAADGTGAAVAVIGAEGPIVTGTGDNAGFGASQTVYSDDIAHAFNEAVKDSDVRAIVFRVSSPGGSDTASEQILAAVRAAKAAKKPVVVSMGTYAASGGYWISSEASEIVAEPTTLTGSIGVFGGKFVIGPALAKVGVDVRDLTLGGDYAGAFSGAQPFSPTQRAAFAGWMDRIYAGFVDRVARGRNLPPARVQEIAKGRVWTGDQAKPLGLIDKVGGFYEAVAEAKRLAGLTPSESVRIKMLPAHVSPFQALHRMFGYAGASAKTLASLSVLLGDPRAQAVVGEVQRARLQANGAAPVLAPTPFR